MTIIIVVLIVLYFWILYKMSKEHLVIRPSKKQLNNMIDQVMQYRNLFDTQYIKNKPDLDMYTIRKVKMPWLDAILYEDIRRLVHAKQLTRQNLRKIFMN